MAVWDSSVVVTENAKATLHPARTSGVFFTCVLLGLLCPSARGAQHKHSKAVFLIARREVQDPYFRQSVVLMLPPTGEPLIVGLIINKPTVMSLAKLFSSDVAPDIRSDHAYFGGPVNVDVPCVVLRASTPPKRALRLYGNVYLTFDSRLITTILRKGQPSSSLRVFLGRAQWAPEQLENEFREGGWYRTEAEGDLVFSPDPRSLWRRLHDPSKYIKYQLPSVRHDTSPRRRSLPFQARYALGKSPVPASLPNRLRAP
jgi:putative transcriptional regulator